jgi:hypothetical protein
VLAKYWMESSSFKMQTQTEINLGKTLHVEKKAVRNRVLGPAFQFQSNVQCLYESKNKMQMKET